MTQPGSSDSEDLPLDLVLELETLKAVNAGLRTYLDHLRTVKSNLVSIHVNFKQLAKVNQEWVDSVQNE